MYSNKHFGLDRYLKLRIRKTPIELQNSFFLYQRFSIFQATKQKQPETKQKSEKSYPITLAWLVAQSRERNLRRRSGSHSDGDDDGDESSDNPAPSSPLTVRSNHQCTSKNSAFGFGEREKFGCVIDFEVFGWRRN